MTPRWRAAGAAIACAVIPLALLLTGCDAIGKLGAAAHYPAATSFTIRARVTTVIIDGGSGSVTVTGTSQSAAAVRVSQQASYSKTPPTAKHTLTGSTLTLSYSCAVQLSCSTGAITLTSVSGAVTAQTSTGLITAVNLSSATVSLKADAGGIIATCVTAPLSLHASTTVGAITLTVPGSAAYKVDTHTVVGTSTITVRTSARSPHQITASSDLGSISVSPA
jgi:hypothetical protein